MRWSISKSVNLGPFRFTISKTGITVSMGVPGARASINTKGETGIRVGTKGFAYTKRKKLLPSLASLFGK